MVASGGGTISRFPNIKVIGFFCSQTSVGAKGGWRCIRGTIPGVERPSGFPCHCRSNNNQHPNLILLFMLCNHRTLQRP
jgi:hypothetical protein